MHVDPRSYPLAGQPPPVDPEAYADELPDLAGRIQVGLFNILQEGDVQIKGYKIRLPLDLVIVAKTVKAVLVGDGAY